MMPSVVLAVTYSKGCFSVKLWWWCCIENRYYDRLYWLLLLFVPSFSFERKCVIIFIYYYLHLNIFMQHSMRINMLLVLLKILFP